MSRFYLAIIALMVYCMPSLTLARQSTSDEPPIAVKNLKYYNELSDTQKNILLELARNLSQKNEPAIRGNILRYLQGFYDNSSAQQENQFSPLHWLLRNQHATDALDFLDHQLTENRYHFSDLTFYDFKTQVVFAIASTANYEHLYYRLLPFIDEVIGYQSIDLKSDQIIVTLHYAHAQGLFRVGQYGKAAYHYQQAKKLIDLHPELDNRKPVIDVLLGELFVNLHAPDEALPYLRRAIVTFPKERGDGRIFVRTMLAALYMQKGELERADEILANVIFLKNSPRTDFLLHYYELSAHLRILQKRYEGAKILTDAGLKDAERINSLYFKDAFEMILLYLNFQKQPDRSLLEPYEAKLNELPSTENSFALFYSALFHKMLVESGENEKAAVILANITRIENKLEAAKKLAIAELSKP